MINTKDLRGDVDRAYPIRIVARDYRGAPIPLTGAASAWLAVTADAKVPALFLISSLDTLALSFGTTVRGRAVSGNVGLPITVAVIDDAPAGVTIDNVDNAVTIHFKPSVATITQLEAAVTAATTADCPLVVTVSGVGATILTSADVVARSLVTAVVILEQTTYPGQYVATLTRERTALLRPTGDADPYLWDTAIYDKDLQPYSIVSQSRLSMFQTATTLP